MTLTKDVDLEYSHLGACAKRLAADVLDAALEHGVTLGHASRMGRPRSGAAVIRTKARAADAS